jgi:dUTPase
MKIRFKRFDKSIPVPEYKTEGAACFDLYARETTKIKPKETALIPTNFE